MLFVERDIFMNYQTHQTTIQKIKFEIQPKKLNGLSLLRHRLKYYWCYLRDIIDIKISEREFRAGKGKILHSFSDLDRDQF